MKKHLPIILAVCIISIKSISNAHVNDNSSSGCSLAGTASLQQDSICYEDTTTLMLTGYVGSIQWQSFDGANWINETGTGSTTDNYSLVPGETKNYRALVTNGICVPDSSNIITITVGTIPVPSGTGDSRCGPGMVTLTGSGNGTIQWYLNPVGGAIAGTGSPFNTYVPGTTTYYLEDNTGGGSGGSSPILITGIEVTVTDFIEIQNVTNQPVDVTGWKVAASNNYGDINIVNANVQVLSGIMQPGETKQFSDVTTTPNSIYWGSNLLFNPGSYPTFTGWVMILDNNNVPLEFVAMNWLESDIYGMVATIDGLPVTIDSLLWTGNGIDITNASGSAEPERQGNLDNNSSSDFILSTPTFGITNPGMVLPFSGFGCSSPRVPINVTVTTSDAVSIAAVPPALCEGQSSVLTATSTNLNYSYTWTPDTMLSSSTGASVTATPTTPITYIVVGDDGVCSNRDTVFIDVGPLSQSGTASLTLDSICLGTSATLSVAGSVGNIQWQSNTGSGWVNETGPGSDSAVYEIAPFVNTQYQAVVTSGGCDPDTSVTLSVTVLSVTTPVVNDTTLCANTTVTLTASGTGPFAWYNVATGGADLFTGNPFTTPIIGDTTFYVEAKAGSTNHIGPASNAIGNSAQSVNAGWGLGFDVTRLCVLEKVYVYPTAPGNVIINLVDPLGGTQTITQYAVPSVNKTAIGLGWLLAPGSGYSLELDGASVPLRYNYTGASYPYASASSPVTITGFLDPFLSTGDDYYYFYDWVLFEGCSSARVPLNITTTPPQPVIVQAGTLLTSSASTGNQWYLNGGLIPGATNQTLIISQVGLYSVSVTVNGCTATGSLTVTAIGIDELQSEGISVYPNPVVEKINVDLKNNPANNIQVRLLTSSGAIVFEEINLKNNAHLEINAKHIEPGLYLMELTIDDKIFRKSIVKY